VKKVTLFFVFFTISSSLIFADEAADETYQSGYGEPGYHEHDGLYFRSLTGFGYGYFHSAQISDAIDVSQDLQNLTYQAGYTINKKIIVFIGMEAVLPIIVGPSPFQSALYELKSTCIVQEYARCFKNTDYGKKIFTIFSISVGVSYYFMPQNIYLSTVFQIPEVNNEDSYTQMGFGLQSSIGKEWWVSKNWGIGLALNIFYDYLPKTAPGLRVITPLHAFGIGLSFSATYN